MNEPRFKRGQTVTILPRTGSSYHWDNSYVGQNAIIQESIHDENVDRRDYEDGYLYRLWVLFDEDYDRTCYYFEERFLELYCSNEKRGLKILEAAGVLLENDN